MKNFRNIFAAIFLMMVAFIDCSKDPASPSNNEQNKPIVTATIGPGGGHIETENISISIPAGAFNANHDIALYDIADDQAFGENTVSTSYKISGLPNEYQQPLKVSIKYSGELSGQSFIAVGDRQFDSATSDDSSTVYDLFPASDSSGYLVGELPAVDEAGLTKSRSALWGNPFHNIIGSVTAYDLLQTDNFEITYPKTLEFHASYIGTALEDAYSIVLSDLGFSFNKKAERWKATVIIQTKAVTGYFSTHSPKLNISRDLVRMGKYSDIKLGTGEQFIEQAIYYNYYNLLPFGTLNAGYFWLETAIKTWAEELFTDDPDFQYPANFAANTMAPFNGMRAGAGVDFEPVTFNNHGYGMSSLIKYMVDDSRFGKTGIAKTYQDIGKGVDPTAALIKNMDAMVADWWPDFFKQYVNGDIYNRSIDDFLNNTTLEWNINNDNDMLKVFSSDDAEVGLYPDLSAKLFKINLNHSAFESNHNMLFSMTGPANADGLSLVVFGIKDGKATYMGTAFAQDFEIPNLKEYYDNNMRQFLVVLTNIGTSDVDFTITVGQSEQSDLKYTRCAIYITVLGVVEDTRLPEGQTTQTTNHSWGIYGPKLNGIFSGNTFYGAADNGLGKISTATITLNDAHDTIIDYSCAQVETRLDVGTNYEIRIAAGASGQNIPVDTADKSTFKLMGPNVCDGISTLLYSKTWDYSNVSDHEDDTFTLTSFSCDVNSTLHIIFYQ